MKLKFKNILPITLFWLCATACIAEPSVVVMPKKESEKTVAKPFFLDSKDKKSEVDAENFKNIAKQNIIKNDTPNNAKEGMFDKFLALKAKEKAFILIALAVIPIFLWGILRFTLTGKQFSDSEYTVIEKVYTNPDSYIEKRKYINSGKIFYIAEGDFPRELTGGITSDVYEKIKRSAT
jgi:hypothetical protein